MREPTQPPADKHHERARIRPGIPAGVTAASVEAELEKILAHEAFVHSDRLTRFLRFAVQKVLDGEEEQIKEYTLGVSVFDRGESFDPRVDPIVRVEARRLRSKLRLYYDTNGRDDPLRIEIPTGSYIPILLSWPPPVRKADREDARARSRSDARTIAVLSFEDMSPEQDQEYFCDGIAEELTDILTRVEGLRVVARTSAFVFKGKRLDIRKIAEALGAGTVLEGSVRKAGNELRIKAQLINAADGCHLWTNSFHRELKDVFAVQEEISKAIAKALKLRLAGPGNRPLVKVHTKNLEAYNLYLKGRYCWNKQTEEGMKQAIGYFEQATAEDANFAMAHVGMSDCHRLLAFWGSSAPGEAMPRAKTAALRALEIDDNLGEAHASLAGARGLLDWDWPGAGKDYERALALNPNYPIARQSYAMAFLAPMGRIDEAIAQMKRAQELDPLSLFHATILGWAFHFARQYDRAIEQYRKTLELDTNFYLAYLGLGWAYEQKAMLEEAVAALQKAAVLSNRDPFSLGSLGHAYGKSGKRSEALKLLRTLERRSHRNFVPVLDIAVIHAGLGQDDQAIEWLEKAYDAHCPRLVWVKLDPRFDALHANPGFVKLLSKLGLPA